MSPESPASTTVKLPLPEQIIAGRYRLLDTLGHGGMGLVFLAEQVGVGNRVAVKFLDPEPSGDPSRIARFLREGRVGLEVRHPGAAQVLDMGRDESMRLFIVFELVEGVDVRGLLDAEGRLSWAEARAVTLKVAEVLHFAHQQGVVHRDVKPENVRVRRDLSGVHVKVLDFGIARLLQDAGLRLTADGGLAGTPRYMAPEQIRDGLIDARTDAYALGLTFFEMLTGVPAFSGRNVSDILLKQVQTPAPALHDVAPDLYAPVVDAFIARACAKAPDERFPDMAAFVEALLALPIDAATWPRPRLVPVEQAEAPTLSSGGPVAGLSDTLLRVEETPAPAAPPRTPAAVSTTPATPAPPAPARYGEVASTVLGAPVPTPEPPSSARPARRRPWLWLGALAALAAAALRWWPGAT